MTSFAYPTPYVGINGFILYTSMSQDQAHGECLIASASEGIVQGAGIHLDGLGSTTISLNSTYYSPIPGMALTGTDVSSILLSFYENVGMDTSSFSAFLQSNTELMSSFPMLASCLYQPYGFGPPAFKIPVSAMTATTTAITQFSGNPPSPGSAVKPPVAPQTTPRDTYGVPTMTPPNIPTVDQTPKAGKPIEQSSPIVQPEPQTHPPSPAAPLQSASPPSPPAQPAPPSYHPNDSLPKPGDSIPTSALPNKDAPSRAPLDVPAPQSQDSPKQAPAYPPSQNQGSPNSPSPQTLGPISQALSPAVSSQNQGSPYQVIPISFAPQPPVLAFGGSAYTADSASKFILGSQTLSPGSPPITVSGTPVSLASGGSVAVVGSSTAQLYQADVPAVLPVLSLGGAAYTAASASAFVIAGQTLTPGGGITVSGTPISLAPGGSVAVVGSGTAQLHQAALPTILPALSIGGVTYTATSASAFVIAGQTLTPGGSITVSGTPLFYPSTNNVVVVGSSTQQLSSITIKAVPAPIFTFAGSSYTANPTAGFIIGGQTLTKGGVITVSGAPLFYPPNDDVVVVGSSTQQLSSNTITAVPTPIFTFAGSTYTANPSAGFVIGGQTLTKGGVVTVSGTPLFYPTTGDAVVVGSSTQQLSSNMITAVPTPIFTFGGSTYTGNPTAGFVIGGQTLTRGAVVTISGTPVSYASDGGDVVVGTSTEALGSVIMNGFGGRPSSTASNGTVFVGGAEGRRRPSWIITGFIAGMVGFILIASV